MFELYLPIFPETTFATAITTTVLVGVWVVVFFNLRFGWMLSGLVVPGYVAPLIIAKPTSAVVILVEAVITYGIVWFLSEGFKYRACWSSVFGRDRFCALVLVSVLVRLIMDGWLLPAIGPALERVVGGEFDHRNHLHSYGLIIVALVANYLWKPGLGRGLGTLAVTVGATYVIIRFVLMEFTNFNVGSLQYMYEDVATSLLASPKSYIILITTAFIASWMNLHYSWDYNGILVPSLLALQWYNPYKILASFVEAFVILLLARAVLQLPIWHRTTMEAGRKILLFFSIAFVYRIALGCSLPILFPEIKVTDAFGFGYLLSTLLAIRAHDKDLLIRVTRASVQVSMTGAVVGSLIGFALTLLPEASLTSTASGTTAPPAIGRIGEELISVLRRNKVALYRHREPESFVPPQPDALSAFARGLQRLDDYRASRRPEDLSAAAGALIRANYRLSIVQDRYLYLHEMEPSRGWGIFVLALENHTGLVVEVPAPLEEWGTAESGLCLLHHLDGGALAIAGSGRHTNADGSADVLTNPLTIYGAFHRHFGRANVLEVRGQTRTHTRALLRSDLESVDHPTTSSLWVKGAIPSGCNLQKLRRLITGWQLHWRESPVANVIREQSRSEFAELLLTRADRRTLQAGLAIAAGEHATQGTVAVNTTPIRQWLLERKNFIADRGTNLYQPAKLEELLYLDEQVVKPLSRLVLVCDSYAQMSAADKGELRAVAAGAEVLGCQLTIFTDQPDGNDLVALSEPETGPCRHWGTYVFPLGGSGSHIVEIPRPVFERNTLEFGALMLERVPAAALLLAGAHPSANTDGSADVIQLENRQSMFNLVHQVLVREAGPRPMMIASIRAIREPVHADVVIAWDDGARTVEEFSPLQLQLISNLRGHGLHVQLADGSSDTAGYDVGVTPQFTSLAHSENKEFAAIWLSPSVRRAYRVDENNRLQLAQFNALGIPTVEDNLHRFLVRRGNHSQQYQLPGPTRALIDEYAMYRDIVRLRKVQAALSGRPMTRLIDRTTGKAFLVIEDLDSDLLPSVVSLAERVRSEEAFAASSPLTASQVREYVSSPRTWLEVRQP